MIFANLFYKKTHFVIYKCNMQIPKQQLTLIQTHWVKGIFSVCTSSLKQQKILLFFFVHFFRSNVLQVQIFVVQCKCVKKPSYQLIIHMIIFILQLIITVFSTMQGAPLVNDLFLKLCQKKKKYVIQPIKGDKRVGVSQSDFINCIHSKSINVFVTCYTLVTFEVLATLVYSQYFPTLQLVKNRHR